MAATRDIGSEHLYQINLDGIVMNDFERDGLHPEVLSRRAGWRVASPTTAPAGAAPTPDAPGRATHGHREGHAAGARAMWTGCSACAGLEDTLLKRYGHDSNGELVHEEHSRHGATVRRYDKAGRIVASLAERHPALQEAFHFDLAGNRIRAFEAQPLSTQGRGWVGGTIWCSRSVTMRRSASQS
ncbi:hypothetical protein J7373_13505 [Xanthomonas sp. A2111]|uniref:RHS repeat protein n=1 Tax=Xanthomonas hawaiiensis TaxID=3003247 RepID=A0ABU2IAE8_9XANT|nr:hypothetical protein [Xanthomonas sp. A2111]MBO9829269.1 hypothetical protein [Xanthomonas sp. A2111]MDS9995101.1 hypothetical protein [Xanthomonas sp. A2111]